MTIVVAVDCFSQVAIYSILRNENGPCGAVEVVVM
jgi:hypothetical protein